VLRSAAKHQKQKQNSNATRAGAMTLDSLLSPSSSIVVVATAFA